MYTNENKLDRILRVMVAAVLVSLVALKLFTGVAGIIFATAAAVLLLTGIFGFCGIYALFGLSTCKIPRKP